MIQWSDFFKILTLEKGDKKFAVEIEFNPGHDIFKGHFPGNPVVPGVCMVQIIKEILREIYGKSFTMKQASNLKFLSVINPDKNQVVQVDISILKEDANGLEVSGSIFKSEIVFLKYKAAFESQE